MQPCNIPCTRHQRSQEDLCMALLGPQVLCPLAAENRHRGSAPRANAPFWYSYDYGSVHFTVISTEHSLERGSPQYRVRSGPPPLVLWLSVSPQSGVHHRGSGPCLATGWRCLVCTPDSHSVNTQRVETSVLEEN